MSKQIVPLLLLVAFLAISCSTKKPEPKKNSFAPVFEAYKKTLTEKRINDIQLIESIPALSLTTLDGKEIEVGHGGSRPAVIIFFTTWCPVCERALPQIDLALDKELRRKVSVIAVGREHTEAELHVWRKMTGNTLDVVADPTKDIYLQFADKIIPRIYLIDGNGNVIYQDVGWNERIQGLLFQAIESLQ